MLLSHTEQEWKEAYKSASTLLENMPLKQEKLDDIYNRASYYAGYYLCNITGNLNCHGSAPAEQNHSSVNAHFGESGAWTIIFQINKLMERQNYFINKDTTKHDNLFMIQHKYESEFNGDLSIQDTAARQSLSQYAYENLWLKVLKRKDKFQHKMMNDGITNCVWPVGEMLSVDNLTKFHHLETCGCHFHKTWDCPCEHQFAVRVVFDATKYAKRWLCKEKFEAVHPKLCPTLRLNEMPNMEYTITDETMHENEHSSSATDTNTNEQVTQHHTAELSQHRDAINYSTIITAAGRVSYTDLSNVTGQLVAAVVNSRKKANSVMKHCTEWLRKLRLNHNFTPTFIELPCIDSPKKTN